MTLKFKSAIMNKLLDWCTICVPCYTEFCSYLELSGEDQGTTVSSKVGGFLLDLQVILSSLYQQQIL